MAMSNVSVGNRWTMNDIVKWLESPEGENWSWGYHHSFNNYHTNLVSIKDDNLEGTYDPIAIIFHTE